MKTIIKIISLLIVIGGAIGLIMLVQAVNYSPKTNRLYIAPIGAVAMPSVAAPEAPSVDSPVAPIQPPTTTVTLLDVTDASPTVQPSTGPDSSDVDAPLFSPTASWKLMIDYACTSAVIGNDSNYSVIPAFTVYDQTRQRQLEYWDNPDRQLSGSLLYYETDRNDQIKIVISGYVPCHWHMVASETISQ